MFQRILLGGVLLLLLSTLRAQNAVAEAEQQTKVMLAEIPNARGGKSDLVSPRTLDQDRLKLVNSRDWTSGFFAGQLWYLYETTGKNEWKQEAIAYTLPLEKEQFNAGTHDMGFKMNTSFGNGYRLTHDPHYRDVLIQSAKTLSTRFNPKVGSIKSWDNRKEWGFPVIIDNMMNLELLFLATKLTGDSSFYHIAVQHARTTMKNHYRPDYSSYHVIDYDTATGQVLHRNTHQGYSDASAWARGQAWGLYGFTMCYRETHDKQFLQQAEHIAGFLKHNPHMPADDVPYWDYDAPDIPNAPRDASAAAIMASALYELSMYSKQGKEYRQWADKIMNSLEKNYRAAPGTNRGFLLLHSTGHKPANSEIDVPINYADYYYIEALLRSRNLQRKRTVF